MRIYQFHFYNPRGAYPALDFADCPDDGAARREAFGQLRHHGSCQGVEVFDGDRLVGRVERAGHDGLSL
ncbi:MAG TPA: hypothetical protein VFF48_12555 [Brevundimonas sp.]|nr:hypothetical protein [Brevundimonas sp.]